MVEQLKKRTKAIGIQAIEISKFIPDSREGTIVAKQLIRCSTSVGANYRAAIRSKSKRDFIYKLKIVEEEADETIYWLEVIEEAKILKEQDVKTLKSETNQILAIIVQSIKTVIANHQKPF